MGRLCVILTSPRLPGGLLTPAAWQAVQQADLVAVDDARSSVAEALRSVGLDVVALPGSSASDLLTLAADQVVVWLSDDDSDLTRDLANVVVGRSESPADRTEPEVEIVVGSFDPVGARLLDAVAVMETLRDECPWDREQTHESLLRFLVEETYEVVEAIESGKPERLSEELGDLLFQVLFHARVAAERNDEAFTIDDVAGGLVEKLVRRHPHVFAGTAVSGVADVEANWDRIKQAEKGRASVVEGIPLGLPALSLADSVIERAVRGKAPLSVPVPEAGTTYTEETLGEVLFALVAAARAGGLDSERALRMRVRREIEAVRSAEQRAVPANAEPRR